MNISVCITVLDEEKSIGELLQSLLEQTKKPDEIIVVDGGSTDRTLEIINHYQRKDSRIKLLKEKCSRAKGRNLGIDVSKNAIIAITDAGCVAHHDWLEQISEPLKNGPVGISAGFYKMVGETLMQKAMAVYLGTLPNKFNVNFLPSTRSMAFKKQVWEEIGGFPDEEKNSAEDTYFNFHALKLGTKYARVKSAIVEWGMPKSLSEFFQKIKTYAMWDARTKIIIFPRKGLASHNIKAFFTLLRYVAGVALLIFAFKFNSLFPILVILFFLYLSWAYRKVYLAFGDRRIATFGPLLQIIADFGVIIGLLNGLL